MNPRALTRLGFTIIALALAACGTEPPATSTADQALTNSLTYHGGPLAPSPQVTVLLWKSSVNANVKAALPGFYQTILNSSYLDWLGEYDQPGYAMRRGTYLGMVTDPSPPVATTLTQAQIEAEFVRLVNNGTLPHGPSNITPIYFPHGYTLFIQDRVSCPSTADNFGFCGYHHSVATSFGVQYYTIINDEQDCGTFCGPSDQLGDTTSSSSHELFETITDPTNLGYHGSDGETEIADLCQVGSPAAWQAQVGGYTVQNMWSQQFQRCQVSSPVAARFLGQSGVPTTMYPGDTATVSLTFANSGEQTWTSATNFKLAQSPAPQAGDFGPLRVELAASDAIAPGQAKTFTFAITAPTTLGVKNFQFAMVKEGYVYLYNKSPATPINIVARPEYGAAFVSQHVPTSLFPGQTVSVDLTFKNAGTHTWTAAEGFKLGSQSPQDNIRWGSTRQLLDAGDAIATNQQKTFAFSITAPTTPGTYPFQWGMLREGVAWIPQFSTALNVTAASACGGNACGAGAVGCCCDQCLFAGNECTQQVCASPE